MDEKTLLLGLKLLPLGAALFLFLFLFRLSVYHPRRILLRTYEVFSGILKENQETSTWYLRNRAWLLRNGAGFHYGSWMNPVRFLVIRIVLAMLGLAACSVISLSYGVFAAAVLYVLPRGFLVYLNRKDNERMLPEVKLVYHALEMQIRAGVYVTDALAECYGSVQDKRLRQALLDLAGDIVMKADIYEALEHFQRKFDNRYIDSLCITILQALESGQAVELLSDIGEQIKDMESAVLGRKKGSLDRSLTFYQLGVLAAIMGVVLYACVGYMFSAAASF